MGPVREQLLRRLERACPDAGGFSSDPATLASYRRDQTVATLAGDPAALVRPTTTAQVGEVLSIAAHFRVPVVPRGAGTGLAGGANAVDGCIVLSTEGMASIMEVDVEDRVAVVQAGVINGALSEAVMGEGLRYAPDPASRDISTIGGNIATNAGGLCCVRHGSTRDHLLGVEVAMANGTIVQLGGRTSRGVVGYDLRSLVCGSEGTLGVITSATVRLLPVAPPVGTVVATFPTIEAAMAAVTTIMRATRPTLLEVMDDTTTRAVEEIAHMDLSSGALLFAQIEAVFATELDGIVEVCRSAGAQEAHLSLDPVEAAALLDARRLAHPALERLGHALLDDVAVPVSQLAAVVRAIERIARRHDVVIGTFGHAGDGNLHPTIVVTPGDAASMAAGQEAFAEIVEVALSHGGTATGEHGIGSLKLDFLECELGSDVSALNAAVKHAFDPAGLMNPGKAIGPALRPVGAIGG